VQSLISGLGRREAYLTIGLFAIALLVPPIIIFLRRSPADKGTVPDGTEAPALAKNAPAARHISTEWSRTEWTLARALRTRTLWLIFAADFFMMGIAQQVQIAHSVYFFRDAGFTAQGAANVFSFYGVGIIIGYMFAYVSDRVGRERIIIPGCMTGAAGTALLFAINGPDLAWLGAMCMFLCGLGMGASVTTFFATVADLFHGKHYGSIMGFVTFGFSLGGAFSPWFVGHLNDITGSNSTAFSMVVGALLLAALLIFLAAPRKLTPVPGARRPVVTPPEAA